MIMKLVNSHGFWWHCWWDDNTNLFKLGDQDSLNIYKIILFRRLSMNTFDPWVFSCLRQLYTYPCHSLQTYYLLLFDFKERPLRLVTFMTFDRSDEETNPRKKRKLQRQRQRQKHQKLCTIDALGTIFAIFKYSHFDNF